MMQAGAAARMFKVADHPARPQASVGDIEHFIFIWKPQVPGFPRPTSPKRFYDACKHCRSSAHGARRVASAAWVSFVSGNNSYKITPPKNKLRLGKMLDLNRDTKAPLSHPRR
jgi:hypothetical protein